MALWGGRFTQEADQKFKFFNDSLRFDYRLALQDIDGSIGWAKAITSVGILTEEEHQQLVAALKELRAEIEPKIEIILKDDAEDIHSWVESKLIEKVGDLGKKLHTGRSRNDQVAVDMKMWCKAQVIVMQERIRNLQEKLVLTAEASQHAVMPGYTHLQRAQPITFAHWCMAYFEMLERDYSRLTDAYKRMHTCPLGSGALAGTAYAIDRDALAKDLGFSIGTHNSLDSVSDRDHVLELLSNASISMVHLSRFAEDLIFFNSGESAFLELSDRVTSGSSLMPQKKNPDACELIRGKSGRVFGSLTGLLTTLKGLPLAYNKDMQEDKEMSFDAIDTVKSLIKLMSGMLSSMKFNNERMAKSARGGFTNATDAADYLVKKNVAFRDAHEIVGRLVLYGIEHGKALDDFSLEEFRNISEYFDYDIYDAISLKTCVEKRNTKGAPGLTAIMNEIKESKKLLESIKK